MTNLLNVSAALSAGAVSGLTDATVAVFGHEALKAGRSWAKAKEAAAKSLTTLAGECYSHGLRAEHLQRPKKDEWDTVCFIGGTVKLDKVGNPMRDKQDRLVYEGAFQTTRGQRYELVRYMIADLRGCAYEWTFHVSGSKSDLTAKQQVKVKGVSDGMSSYMGNIAEKLKVLEENEYIDLVNERGERDHEAAKQAAAKLAKEKGEAFDEDDYPEYQPITRRDLRPVSPDHERIAAGAQKLVALVRNHDPAKRLDNTPDWKVERVLSLLAAILEEVGSQMPELK